MRCRRLVAAGLLLGLGGCQSDGGKGFALDCRAEGIWERCTGAPRSSRTGELVVPLAVDGGRASFLLAARSSALLVVDTVEDPDGRTVLDYADWAAGDELLSAGILFLGRNEAALNWPVREEDGPLAAGDWTLRLLTLTADGRGLGGQEVAVETLAKADDRLDDGQLTVRVVYADGVDALPEVVAATEAATAVWADIWGAAGIALDLRYEVDGIDAALPSVSAGSAELARISGDASGTEVTLLVGESIGGEAQVLGESGGIPGPLSASAHGLVAVSWLSNAGADGRFDAEDLRIYGETMAHEVGHYLGLFHPVELDFSYRDALADTPDCGTTRGCEQQLAANNLFPYPVCGLGGCVVQDELTDDQVGVLQRYTGVR